MKIFAECTSDGHFQNLLCLSEIQIILIDKDENAHGVYQMQYKENAHSKVTVTYFIEALQIKLDYDML